MKPHRQHKGYFAFLAHRLSGVALALFLPIHFLVLGSALNGADALDSLLAFSELPWVKFAEWALLVLLALHLLFGLRVLVMELTDWPHNDSDRSGWVIPIITIALFLGFVFVLQL